jgi:predicted membrane metal-binding protein
MSRSLGRPIRRTTVVAVFCACILTGVAVARLARFDVVLCVVSLAIFAWAWRWKGPLVLVAAALAGTCLGGWRGGVYMDKLALYQGYVNTKVTVIGTAAGDGVYGRQKQLTFDLQDAYVADASKTQLAGKIGISGFGENMIFRGDTIQVTGKLKAGTGSHQGWMSFAEMHAVARDTSLIEKVRHRFGAGMMTALPEPLASFGMGILIGQRSTLPEDVGNDLLKVGLVHIIAVSGYNLTIILRAGMRPVRQALQIPDDAVFGDANLCFSAC